ncbi:hypothetical protein [Palleronia sp. LCG004]|uniref:hypothetical protein n=1 Tax=Palleronia sp. LCG004 TaxID=3079304 RepID=UPI00294366B5|nr:hypothetical protein [Palleronia sp. LCG004]WOI58090.1 hypothetical protein RVY76_17275 [Palleronia sp. LCG004]
MPCFFNENRSQSPRLKWDAPGIVDLDFSDIDRDPRLPSLEREALSAWMSKKVQRKNITANIPKTYAPLGRIWGRFPQGYQPAERSWKEILFHAYRRDRTIWGFDHEDWSAFLRDDRRRVAHGRQFLFATAYFIGGYKYTPEISNSFRSCVAAELIFGRAAYWSMSDRLEDGLEELGYKKSERRRHFSNALAKLVLETRSIDPSDFTEEALWKLSERGHAQTVGRQCGKISHALAYKGYIPNSLRMRVYEKYQTRDTGEIAPEWVAMATRWRRTSTIGKPTRVSTYGTLLKIGLWLARTHPKVRSPADWDVTTAAEAIAIILEMCVGDYAVPGSGRVPPHRLGKPLMVNSRSAIISHLRRFFHDIQIWGWVEPRFNPRFHLSTPRKILNQRGPNPRVIDEPIWLKLVWAATALQP